MDVTKMQGLRATAVLILILVWGTPSTASVLARSTQSLPPSEMSGSATQTGRVGKWNSPLRLSAKPLEIHIPGASFVKLHFDRFDLPAGLAVEVRNPEGSEAYVYSRSHRDPYTMDRSRGDDGKTRFSAMSISGDTAIVRITGDIDRIASGRYRVVVDSYLTGSRATESPPSTVVKKQLGKKGPLSNTETTCGVNERYDAVCWKDTHPDEYSASIAVAILITSSGEECTAWRVGSGNHMFTAEHCISDQADLDGSEIWFNYETRSCGGSATADEIKVTGKDLLAVDQVLDYALFSVNDFSEISSFGYLGLDVREGITGEGIFIPQHGLGQPKQIALESDMNNNGLCQIDDNDLTGYASGSDIGYFCDTTTSSSGAPVIAGATGKVIALHHLGGCFNSGAKVSLIWPQVADHFGGVVPGADGGGVGSWDTGNQLPIAEFTANCDALSCIFDASYSEDSDGSIVSFSWDLGDGALTSEMNVEHEYDEGGEYEVALTVEDDEGATARLVKTVSPVQPNEVPIARFSTRCIGNECEFDAGASEDEDGNIVSWIWSLGDGAGANGEEVGYRYRQPGSYTITLTVEDDDGSTDSVSNRITLSTSIVSTNQSNDVPTARFRHDCTGQLCRFDAGRSEDSDGEIVEYRWALGDGNSATGQVIEHLYAGEGSVSVTLTVLDAQGASDSRTRSILVKEANTRPFAEFSIDCEELRCTLDAGDSADIDGAIVSFEWDFGDGGTGQGRTVNHEYREDGQYDVSLSVTDEDQATDTINRLIEVSGESEILLSGTGSGKNGRNLATLRWAGAEADFVNIYRDGRLLTAVANDGKFIDPDIGPFSKSVSYRLCEMSTALCSNEITLILAP